MDKFEWFKMEISYLTADEQVELFNDFCEHINKPHNKIYPMDMFNETFKDKTPLEIVELCNSYKINYKDRYFTDWFGIQTLSDLTTYIGHFCNDIFKCEEIWKQYIDEEEYINGLYERLCYLKPDDMDVLVFLEIISNAADLSIYYDDIKEEVSKKVKETKWQAKGRLGSVLN